MSMMVGRVTRIPVDGTTGRRRGFCFVEGTDGVEVFVHATALARDTKQFVDLEEGDQIQFEPEDGDKGLRAKKGARVV